MHKLVVDGACLGNPGISAAGMLIINQKSEEIFKGSMFLGEGTNNTAEYRAVLEGLKAALRVGISNIEVYSDSQLVIRQLNGQYKVKSGKLKDLNMETREVAKKFNSVKFYFSNRTKTTAAHNLAEGILKTK